jgi:hypothetical protein
LFEEQTMTEPTSHYRPDVAVHLDIVLARIMAQVGLDELDTARERLARHLAAAWHDGWMAGHEDGTNHRSPTSNPYHETDKT